MVGCHHQRDGHESLTIQTFFSKVMSLLLATLSRFFIVLLTRSKCLLISWLQSVCSDFGAQENKIPSGKVKYSCLFKNFPQFVVIHTIKGFSIVNEADVFLELPCFFHDPECWQFGLWFLCLF